MLDWFPPSPPAKSGVGKRGEGEAKALGECQALLAAKLSPRMLPVCMGDEKVEALGAEKTGARGVLGAIGVGFVKVEGGGRK